MTDHLRDDPDDGERLAAYLADELDRREVRRLEQRLVADAALRRRLDAIHDTVVMLRGVDDVAPPDDLAASVHRRIAGERDTAAELSGVRRVPPPARTPWWRRPVAAVAALALLAVVTVSSLWLAALGDGASEDAATTVLRADGAGSADGAAADDAAAAPEGATGAPTAPAGRDRTTAALSAPTESAAQIAPDGAGAQPESDAGPDAPLVEASPVGLIDIGTLDGPMGVRDYLVSMAQEPTASALRAMAPQQVLALAEQQRALLRRDSPLDDACVDTLVSAEGPAAVRLVSGRLDGRAVVGAVLPTAGGGLRAVLVSRDGCDTVADEVVPATELP